MSGNRARTNRSQTARQPGKSTPESAPKPASRPANGPEWDEMSGNERQIEKSDLTFRQRSALPIVAASPTIAQAARTSGVGESTLRRWLEEDSFRDELTRSAESPPASPARNSRASCCAASPSLPKLWTTRMWPSASAPSRYALSFAVQICEVEKLRSDIQALEEVLPLWAAHHALKINAAG